MRDFLAWMQASALGVAMRESGVWSYAVVNLFHILGVSTLFGSILVLDLRLLGISRSKFPAIALGLLNVSILSRLPAWNAHRERALTSREDRQLALMGGLSLASWLTAVSAGRMIGYW